METVSLRPVTAQNWQVALRLGVRPEQQRFVAGYTPIALLGLAKAYVRPGGVTWEPYALYARATDTASGESAGESAGETPHKSVGEITIGTMVGFVELAYEPDSTDEYWVFHFFIDERFQGRGYARAALSRLIAHVRREHPNCQALQLVVHPDNARAQRLYTGAGFRPTGAERWGEPVYRLALVQTRQESGQED